MLTTTAHSPALPVKILVVDDSAMMRRALKGLLERHDHSRFETIGITFGRGGEWPRSSGENPGRAARSRRARFSDARNEWIGSRPGNAPQIARRSHPHGEFTHVTPPSRSGQDCGHTRYVQQERRHLRHRSRRHDSASRNLLPKLAAS